MSGSDDFSSATLDAGWTIEGPSGTSANLGSNATDAYLSLVTPDGNHDVWGTNNGARAMQATANEDFTLETRFLSTPSAQYQIQGLLVEQDAQNWLRFDTYSDGNRLYAFAAITVNGNSSQALKVTIPGNSAPYLQVTRDGNQWTLAYSQDGNSWTTAGSFSHALTVSAAGVVAGNVGGATGFTAQVDYFEVSSDPLLSEDGSFVPVNQAPDAVDDGLTVATDTAKIFTAAQLLGNDSDPDGNSISISAVGQPGHGTLVNNGDGTYTYTPTTGYAGADSFSYTITDGALTDTATVNVTVTASPPPPPTGEAFSDDFSSATLDAGWTIEGPSGTSANLGSNATDAYLSLVTPDGNHDVWGTNNGARAMQATANEDFTLETRFLSTPSAQYQIQGLLVEQDAQNWLRFDTYSDGNRLYAFAAITVNGNSSQALKVTIPGNSAPYLQVTRDGNQWTLAYSQDGNSWTTAGSFSHALTVSAAGVVAGNVGGATGFTAQVDYFEVSSDPLLSEDGSFVPVNQAPDAVDDGLTVATDTAKIFTAAQLLGNDSDPDGNSISISAVGQPGHGTLVNNGDGTYTYTPTTGYAGADSFSYTITDGALTDTATVNVTVTASPPPPPTGEAFSDDFSSATLDAGWTIEGPSGTSANLGSNATDAYLSLVTPDGNHDVWGTNNGARAMQATANEDFTLETRFLSTPSAQYQIQGLLVEQDAQNWLRFDTYSDGNRLYAFAAITVNGNSSQALKVTIPGNSAPYLQVTRDGNQWTLAYSQDGNSWTTAGSFSHALTVSAAGVVAGNVGGATGFTAQVDYFEVSSDPLLSEDGSFVPVNQAPDAVDDGLTVATDTAKIFTAAQLLGNDSDPDGNSISISAVGQPGHGTLVNNGDGTYTYTPTTGYAGADSFSYTITDGALTDTATVNVTVTASPPPPPTGEAFSDDFSSATLDAGWTIEGPSGTSANLGSNATDAYLSLVTPDGNHDVWGTNNGARAMQATANEDFTLETRFLSTPSAQYQIQGLLVEQDAQNWLRFDTYSDGNRLYAFAAITVNGNSSQALKVTIPGNSAPYLQVTRDGNQWTLAYSQDGNSWTTAGSFSHALTVSAAGVVAGNTGGATGFTAQVDYFEVSSDPLLSEDGSFVPVNQAPDAVDDGLTVATDTAKIFTAAQLLGNDSDPDGNTISISAVGQPGHGTLVNNGNGTYTYTPTTGYAGADSFSYTITDGALTDTATVNVTVTDYEFTGISDDFADGTLDPAWTFYGIAGSAQLGTTETDAYVAITSPPGVPVSASDVMTTPRLLQDVNDGDFQIGAGFLSVPTMRYQEHGLLVIQDDENWIRFDLAYTTQQLTLIVGVVEGGSTIYPLFVTVGSGTVRDFRITRTGDHWSFETSADGATWTEAYSMDHVMNVANVGVFAGSAPFSGNPVPGYTAQVDYFEVSNDPIVDEDGTFEQINLAPVANDDSIFAPLDTQKVFTAAQLLGNDSDPDGDAITIVNVGQPSNGTLISNGNGTYTYTPDAGYTGDDSFTYTISDGDLTDSATVTVNVGNPIDVWYGSEQSFGGPGEGQRWVNVLGNVAGDVTSLTYSLNGGPAQTLSLGPDTRRLQENGDFNIDIDYAALNGTSVDDVVTITATLSDNSVWTEQVTIDYEDGQAWAPNYSIDWSTVSNIQDAVQVVDGTWSFDDNGARPVDLGYDRLLVLGDQAWDNYTVDLTITMHDLQNVDPLGRDGGAFAIGMLWGGHTDTPLAGWQPRSGYEPGAAFFYTNRLESHSYHSFSQMLGTKNFTFQEGHTYNFTVQVEQVGLYDRLYSLKAWEVGTAEPAGWTLQGLETFALNEAPATGGLYLNAHYYDVTFGDLTVTEITGRDIIQGTDGNDLLVAVNAGDALPGVGEVDVFSGNEGADTFVFGDASKVYYDDGNAGSNGQADYGYVWDFTAGQDNVQLHGDASDYSLSENASGLPTGTAIWYTGAGGTELIGVLNGVYGLDLSGDEFVYSADLIA